MAYQETTGGSPEDVINKIGAFAASAGWTIATNSLNGSERVLVLRKSGDYVRLWCNATDIWITGHTGYDGSLPYNQQEGYAGRYAHCNVGAGPYTAVFLFGGNNPAEHIHVVIELAGGVFRHISFGQAEKLGDWTGGTYFDATYWHTAPNQMYQWTQWSNPLFDTRGGQTTNTGAMRCDAPQDGRESPSWAVFDGDNAFRVMTGLYGSQRSDNDGLGYLTTQVYDRNDPPFSGQITLGTIRADVIRSGGFYSPVGTFPNVRYLNMARFAPGQEITVGSDVWKVFPMCRKGQGSSSSSSPLYGQPYSDNHAYAFKKED